MPDHGSVVCWLTQLAMSIENARLLWVIQMGVDGVVRSQPNAALVDALGAWEQVGA